MTGLQGVYFRGLCGVFGATLAAMFLSCRAAHAQETAGSEEKTLETVVVHGQRLSNQRALDVKRNAPRILDAVAADDLAKLPDQNLAEALSRVTGVTAFQDEGAGLYVGVRGLSQEFVNLTIDGQEISIAPRTFDSNLRGANLEAVPSTFVRHIEVIKAVTPDIDGDAIAGTVNLVTRSALDADGPWFNAGSAFGGYEEDVPGSDIGRSGKGNLSYGTTFGDGRFGLVFDANVRDIERDNLKPRAWFGPQGEGADLPEEVGGFFYQREEKSYGLAGKLEFRFADAAQGNVSVRYFDSQTGIDKNKHALFGAASDAETGAFTGADGTVRNDRVEYGVDDALTFSAGADWFLGERNTLSVKGSTSSSTSFQDDPRVDWFFGGPLRGTYERTGAHYLYQLDPASEAAFVDPGNYAFNGYRRFQEELEKHVDTAGMDWTHSASAGKGLGYKVGFKWKKNSVDYAASFFRWRNPTATHDFGRYLSVADYRFPETTLSQVILSDTRALSDYVEAIGASGFRRVDGFTNGNDYRVAETVLAGYALADYATDRLRIVGGLRHETTRTESFNRFDRLDDAEFVKTSGDSDDLLPSLALTYFLSEQWLLRAGASRTIGRPDIRDLARGETPPNDHGVFERGNPNLEPRRSTNLDTSLEYYFDGGKSLVSVGVFRKDIEDEIFDLQTPYVYTNELGVDIDSYFIQPTNAGDAEITGVEIGFVKDRLDFLPAPFDNIGFSANLTLNDGEMDLVDEAGTRVRATEPEGLSKRLANATIYYEGERFSARLAYRHVSSQNQTLSVDGSGDLVLDDYQQTDLQLGYRFGGHWELFGEVWNLFEDEQTFTNANLSIGVPNWYEHVRYGRAVWMGVNLTL